MNKQIDDGGSAFPHQEGTFDEHGVYFHSGMTLRDWFAGMALQGKATRLSNPHEHRDILASDCYEIADAMIAERNKQP